MFRYAIRKLLRFLAKNEIKERQYALGITSSVDIENDIHIVMLDYDTPNLNFVLDDIEELIHFWNLGDYEIYKTNKGYHVFFWWTHVPYSRLQQIINFSRCDTSYKYISRFYDYKTIRATGKYKQQDIQYAGKFKGEKISSSHEKEIGNLKRKEYLALKNLSMFNDEVLK